MNDKDDTNDFMKVISAFQDIESLLHEEEETVALPVRDLIDLLPEDYLSMDDPSTVPEGKATLKIDHLFFQLSKGKVEVPVSALAVALPAQFIRPQALEDEHTMIRLPLQAVVKAIDPATLKEKMAAKANRHQAMNIPDPFGPKSELKPMPQPEPAPAAPGPPVNDTPKPVEKAVVEPEPVIAAEPPPEPPSEPAEPEPERAAASEPPSVPTPETLSPPDLPPEEIRKDEVDAVFEEAVDAETPSVSEAASLPEPPAEPKPVEEAVVEPEPVVAAEPPPEPPSEPAEPEPERAAASEPPSEARPDVPPVTIFDSIRSVFARPKTPAETPRESPSAPEPPRPLSVEAPAESMGATGPEHVEIDEADDFGGVNLNTATAEQLMTLNGVTELVAESIVQYRQEKGGFKSIFELGRIPRVGRKTFKKMTGMPYSLSHRHRRLKLVGLLNIPPESIGRLPAIAQRLASRPGFSGCVVSNAEGLALAEHGMSEFAEKLGAVMPHLVRQIGENIRLLEMGAVDSASICIGNRMFTVALSGSICLTVMHKRNTLTRSQLVLVRKTAEELAWLLSHRAYVGRG